MADTSNNPRQPERAQHSLRCDGILHYLGPATKAGIILQTKLNFKTICGQIADNTDAQRDLRKGVHMGNH